MADKDQLDTDKPEDNQVQKKDEVPQYTAAEQKAMENGWVPKDQWDGDPDEWRDARSFNDRGELFKKIEDVGRTNKELKKALADLQSHHAKVREVEYKRALDSLKAQKVTALEEGDAKAIVDIDDRIELVKNEQRKLQETPITQSEANPVFVNWTERNKWYNTDEDARIYADGFGRKLALAGKEPEEVLKEVEQQVKKVFPQLFRNPNRDKPGTVESSSGKGGKSSGETYQLSDDERRVMQRFVRQGVMSEKEYIAEIKRVNGA